jgi:hypothetical protein
LQSYGLNVAQLAKLPPSVIRRAKEKSEEFEAAVVQAEAEAGSPRDKGECKAATVSAAASPAAARTRLAPVDIASTLAVTPLDAAGKVASRLSQASVPTQPSGSSPLSTLLASPHGRAALVRLYADARAGKAAPGDILARARALVHRT